MPKHEWLCEKCGRSVLFRQPEHDDDDRRSEINKDKTCVCGEDMYFDDVLTLDIDPSAIVTPSPEDYSNDN